MIDAKTGALLLDGGVALDPSLDVGAFRRSALGRAARPYVDNPPWMSFFVPAVCRDGTPVDLVLFFRNGFLKSIHLHHHLDRAVNEHEALRIHDAWLRGFLGDPPYEFPWGGLDSSYDPRTASSDVVLVYGELVP
jgi:hypothetical protein